MIRPELRDRIATGLKWGPAVACAIIFQPHLFSLFMVLMVYIALGEYTLILGHIQHQHQHAPLKNGKSDSDEPKMWAFPSETMVDPSKRVINHVFRIIGCGLALAGARGNFLYFQLATAFSVVLLFISYYLIVLSGAKSCEPVQYHLLTGYFAGLFMIAWPLAHAPLFIALPKVGQTTVFLALMASWFGDAAGYFVGKRLGRLQLAPVIRQDIFTDHLFLTIGSPNKSVEGFLATSAFSFVPFLGALVASKSGWISASVIPFHNLPTCIAWGSFVGILGPFGDLMESYLKRVACVKDSGNFFPGHGGVLDRFDSFLLLGPAAYYGYLLFGSQY